MTTPAIEVSGETRWLREELLALLTGPLPPFDFPNNGCSMSPDYLPKNVETWPGCWVHDFHYSGLVPGMTRAKADAIFRSNLWALLRAQGVGVFKAVLITGIYWGAVRWKGGKFFHEPKVEG